MIKEKEKKKKEEEIMKKKEEEIEKKKIELENKKKEFERKKEERRSMMITSLDNLNNHLNLQSIIEASTSHYDSSKLSNPEPVTVVANLPTKKERIVHLTMDRPTRSQGSKQKRRLPTRRHHEKVRIYSASTNS